MNDRFRFRVWDKRKNNYIEDFVFNFIKKIPYMTVEYFDNEYAYTHTFEEDEIIIEQCTGLKDKNGRLIYEGDIVTDSVDIFEVVWDYNAWCIQTNKFQHFLTTGFEVIGNIHENPELVEE